MDINAIRFGPRHALFLDFDGTLVDMAPAPDAVRMSEAMRACLAAANERLGGALAIVSGRPIAEVMDYLAPLELAVAGAHGGERRGADGRTVRLGADAADAADALFTRVKAFAGSDPGFLVERKHGAVALHYRQAPARAKDSAAFMEQAAPAREGWRIVPGKMVIEARRAGVSKGAAIAAFMEEAPFTGRTPLFAGDDVTDEDGFVQVQAMGGTGIKVGPGDTQARERLAGPDAVRDWLASATGMAERTKA